MGCQARQALAGKQAGRQAGRVGWLAMAHGWQAGWQAGASALAPAVPLPLVLPKTSIILHLAWPDRGALRRDMHLVQLDVQHVAHAQPCKAGCLPRWQAGK